MIYRHSKFQYIKTYYWNPSPMGYTMFCCDGSSLGNLGAAGFGVVVRDHVCQVLEVLSGGIGTGTNYIAEVYAVVCAAELAVEWGLKNIVLCSDSKSVIGNFSQGNVPWFLHMRWIKATSKISSIIYLHSFREANFSADSELKEVLT
ncbi:uncharacterized protein LOC113315808 [Papaver somniferum]|uniref:uncharacterized protein LOC113315808 n=1 Tax=Papaver somniferum TaxID=3469 RepID=UPI000E700716|nr:uncharacterized protein LOC113315808 [Papaver somniferum]